MYGSCNYGVATMITKTRKETKHSAMCIQVCVRSMSMSVSRSSNNGAKVYAVKKVNLEIHSILQNQRV